MTTPANNISTPFTLHPSDAMAADNSKTEDAISQLRIEDAEADFKKNHAPAKGADRAANLIGDQCVELTEEDVSTVPTGFARAAT